MAEGTLNLPSWLRYRLPLLLFYLTSRPYFLHPFKKTVKGVNKKSPQLFHLCSVRLMCSAELHDYQHFAEACFFPLITFSTITICFQICLKSPCSKEAQRRCNSQLKTALQDFPHKESQIKPRVNSLPDLKT